MREWLEILGAPGEKHYVLREDGVSIAVIYRRLWTADWHRTLFIDNRDQVCKVLPCTFRVRRVQQLTERLYEARLAQWAAQALSSPGVGEWELKPETLV